MTDTFDMDGMTDRQMLSEILGLLRIIAYEPDDEGGTGEDWKDSVVSASVVEEKSEVSPDSGDGGLSRLVVVKSPLSGENYVWIKRPVGDSFVEELHSVVNFGKG